MGLKLSFHPEITKPFVQDAGGDLHLLFRQKWSTEETCPGESPGLQRIRSLPPVGVEMAAILFKQVSPTVSPGQPVLAAQDSCQLFFTTKLYYSLFSRDTTMFSSEDLGTGERTVPSSLPRFRDRGKRRICGFVLAGCLCWAQLLNNKNNYILASYISIYT